MFRNAAHDQRLALGVMLGGMDAAGWGQKPGENMLLGAMVALLVEGRAVKHAVLNVHPDEVGLGRGHNLRRPLVCGFHGTVLNGGGGDKPL